MFYGRPSRVLSAIRVWQVALRTLLGQLTGNAAVSPPGT